MQRTIFERNSYGLKWENITYTLKKSIKLDTIPSLYSTKPLFLLQTLTNAVQRSLRADGGLFVLTHLEVTRVIAGRAIGANNVMSVSIRCT